MNYCKPERKFVFLEPEPEWKPIYTKNLRNTILDKFKSDRMTDIECRIPTVRYIKEPSGKQNLA
jgi:hypothetical protein